MHEDLFRRALKICTHSKLQKFNKTNEFLIPPKPRDQNKRTSNIDVPVNRLKAANSRIKVPAQAVHVSVSVPVRASGCLTPNFKLT